MTKFRPCIDLHEGVVKQIVGGTLTDTAQGPDTNHVSDRPPEWFAERYKKDGITGGHVIQLGPGNKAAAEKALSAYPGGLQLGGGVNLENAAGWLDAGASQVIVTSMLFDEEARFCQDRAKALSEKIGSERLVIDLSCRRTGDGWTVATNRWQTLTDTHLGPELLRDLGRLCQEFLIHAADVEGKCQGIDEELVERLGQWSPIPVTYAGGARSFEDLEKVQSLSGGAVDLTIGSALDLFGGTISYDDCVNWNKTSAK